MSRTKEYINNLLESGVDVFCDNIIDIDDSEYQRQEEELAYHWYVEKLNEELLMSDNNILENWK